jgi:hypothetical protein
MIIISNARDFLKEMISSIHADSKLNLVLMLVKNHAEK